MAEPSHSDPTPGTRTFTFLGTGTSLGVPQIGCDCETCRSSDPRNQRYRCGVLVTTPAGNILVDTPPELRLQLVRERIGQVNAILYTHYHVDHLFGLDDVRPLVKQLGAPMPLYCTEEDEGHIRRVFAYAFGAHAQKLPIGYVPSMKFERIVGAEPFSVLGQRVVPIPLIHAHYNVLGFRFDDVAYCTDVSTIPDESWPLLEGLRVLVLDALRSTPHPAHFSVDQALEAIARVRPERAYLTHMSHELEHVATNAKLPPGVELAYDGLKFAF